MYIEVKRVDDAYHFEAANEDGKVVQMDAAPAIGGHDQGVRPMEMLLMALGGCSGIDIVNILTKQKQTIGALKMGINGQRREKPEPKIFETIEVEFIFEGDLNAQKVNRAVNLSMEKYCSVTKTLEPTAKITYKVVLNGDVIS